MILDIFVTYLASYLLRLQILLAYHVVISLYLKCVAKQTLPGSSVRAVLIAPIILSNLAAPALFSREKEICTALSVCLLLSWLGNFKVWAEITVPRAFQKTMQVSVDAISMSPIHAGCWALPQSRKPVPESGLHTVCCCSLHADHAQECVTE